MISYILIMAILLLLSAYFSATETAFSCLNKTRLKALAEKGEFGELNALYVRKSSAEENLKL